MTDATPQADRQRAMCPDGCGYEAAHCGCDLPITTTRRQLREQAADSAARIESLEQALRYIARANDLLAQFAALRALAAPQKMPQERKRRHYCGSSDRLTACGRQRNKLSRGSTAFEWNYVNCADCLNTRHSIPTRETP